MIDIDNVAEHALEGFWARVAECCPDIATGDLPPNVDLMLMNAARVAIQAWVDANTQGDLF